MGIRLALFALVTVAAITLNHVTTPARQDGQSSTLRFRWALVSHVAPETYSSVEGDVRLPPTGEIAVYVSPATACSIYLLHERPDGSMALLLRRHQTSPPGEGATRPEYFVPVGDRWQTLQPPGKHRIHLIVSAGRLTGLEAAIDRLALPAEAGSAAATDAKTDIDNFKRMLRRAQDSRARPLPVGTAVRGPTDVLRRLAREVATDTGFAVTYAIEQR
jgi:hypothetical protein